MSFVVYSGRGGKFKPTPGTRVWIGILETHSNRVYRVALDIPPDYDDSVAQRMIMHQGGSNTSSGTNDGEDGVTNLEASNPLPHYVAADRSAFNGIIGVYPGEWAVSPATDRWSVWTLYPVLLSWLFTHLNIDKKKITRDGVSRGTFIHGSYLDRRFINGWAGISCNDGNMSAFNYDEAVHGEGLTTGMTVLAAHDAWIADVIAANMPIALNKVINDGQVGYLTAAPPAGLSGLVPGLGSNVYSYDYYKKEFDRLGYTNYTYNLIAGSHGDASRAFYSGSLTPSALTFHKSCTRLTDGVFT